MADGKKEGTEAVSAKTDGKKLVAALVSSLALVVLLCIFSFSAAQGYADFPSYTRNEMDDIILRLDGRLWDVDPTAKALLEGCFSIPGATGVSTRRVEGGLSVTILTSRSPYVLVATMVEDGFHGVFSQKDFRLYLLMSEGEEVLVIHVGGEEECTIGFTET